MGGNTTAMKRGWNYDYDNSRLRAMVDGVEIFRADGSPGANGYFQMTNTDETQADPGRQVYWQRTYTGTMTAGKAQTGIEIRSTWTGAANADSSEVKGAEIKARGNSTGTYSLGNMRAIVGNTDAKKTDVGTVARVMELVFENSAGSVCADVRGIDVKLQASGTMTASRVAYFHGHSAVFADYGIYVEFVKRPFYAAGTMTGSSALRAFEMAITDETTQSSGYNAAFLSEVTMTGAATPTEYSGGRFNLLLDTGTKTGIWNALKAKVGTGAAPTLTSATVNGIFVSMDDIGATSAYYCMWLEMYAGSSSTKSGFIEVHSQGSTQVKHLFHVMGTNNPTYFMETQAVTGFIDSGATAGDQCIGHIKLLIGGTTGYINFFSDNS